MANVRDPDEPKLHPEDVDRGYGKGPEARYLADTEIKPVLKDIHDRNLLTKLSFSKLRDAAQHWHGNPDIEGVDMSAVQFYPGQIPEDIGAAILETQPNTIIYQKLKPEELLSKDYKVPRPDYEDPEDGVVLGVFYPFGDFTEMKNRWSQVMSALDGEEEALQKAYILPNLKGHKRFKNYGDLRFRSRGRRDYPKTFDEEIRVTDVWDPARYMGTYLDHANDTVSELFVKYYSVPTEGFSPVSLEHAYYIFDVFKKIPGPWKSIGRVLKGIHWFVKDNFAQVSANYDKTTGVITVANVEGPGEFVPALQEPTFRETICHALSEAIVHYMVGVFGLITKEEVDEFDEVISAVYDRPIYWVGDALVDYLSTFLSHYEEIFSYINEENKDPSQVIYYRREQLTLGLHIEPFTWVSETLYKRFVQ